MAMEVRTDPADGLPMLEAGEWAEEKHAFLRKYVDISHGARRRFLTGSGGATYIELFSGPGRLFEKETGTPFDGSSVVACREAARWNTQFTAVHLGDARADFCAAVSSRLGTIHVRPTTYAHRSEEAVAKITGALSPHALHFAFLDPFSFDALPFSIIEALARFRRMDILIHVSAMELQRNLEKYMAQADCPFDRFAPGWRKSLLGMKPDITARGKLLEHWVSLIRSVGFKEAQGMPLIRGPKRQALYWLVLIAKHDLARRFWDAVSGAENQEGLFANAGTDPTSDRRKNGQ